MSKKDYSHYPPALRPKSKKVKEKQRAQRQRVRSKAAQAKARKLSKAKDKWGNVKQAVQDVRTSDAVALGAMAFGGRGKGPRPPKGANFGKQPESIRGAKDLLKHETNKLKRVKREQATLERVKRPRSRAEKAKDTSSKIQNQRKAVLKAQKILKERRTLNKNNPHGGFVDEPAPDFVPKDMINKTATGKLKKPPAISRSTKERLDALDEMADYRYKKYGGGVTY